MRIVFSGISVFREKAGEALLIGKKLPLDRKDAHAFIERWKAYMDAVKAPEGTGGEYENYDFLKAQIGGFIKAVITALAD
jgi:hypothetical protein